MFSSLLLINHWSVCVDCGSADTQEEVEASLLIVGIILVIFFLLCSCQFYQRIQWECEGNTGKKPMPQAPYNRDLSYHPWQLLPFHSLVPPPYDTLIFFEEGDNVLIQNNNNSHQNVFQIETFDEEENSC